MEFKLNKRKVILRPILIVSMVLVLEHLMTSLNLSFLRTFALTMGVTYTYSTLRNQSEVYKLSGEALILEKAGVEIPLTEIDEIMRMYIPLFHYSGITSEGMGYQYFVKFEGYEYELRTACRNKQGESVNEVLHKEFQKEYRDVKGLKLAVRTKNINKG